MANPIFNIVKSNLKDFKSSYNITKMRAVSQKYYFLVESKEIKQLEVMLESDKYSLANWHVSIYEDLRINEEHSASYHVTIKLGNNTAQLVARVYFDRFNKFLFINVKDGNGTIINVAATANIIQFAKDGLIDFYNLLWQTYSDMQHLHMDAYNKLIVNLDKKSVLLDSAKKPEKRYQIWQQYYGQLEAIIKHIKQWQPYEMQSNSKSLDYFINLKNQVTTRLQSIEHSLHPQTKELIKTVNTESNDEPMSCTPSTRQF